MEAKMESLRPCRCLDPNPIVAKIKPGRFIVACKSCPTHAYGNTEAKALEAWNKEVQR